MTRCAVRYYRLVAWGVGEGMGGGERGKFTSQLFLVTGSPSVRVYGDILRKPLGFFVYLYGFICILYFSPDYQLNDVDLLDVCLF